MEKFEENQQKITGQEFQKQRPSYNLQQRAKTIYTVQYKKAIKCPRMTTYETIQKRKPKSWFIFLCKAVISF